MTKHLLRATTVALLTLASVAVFARPAEAAGGLSTNSGATIAEGGGYTPSVASNGTETLVVWEKRHGQGGLADIYGRLTKTDATHTHTEVVRISKRAADEYAPDVAWNGSSFLVVWEAGIGGHQEIHGQRVTKAGATVGGELAISTRHGGQYNPTVTAGANGQFLVAWEDDRNADTTQTDIYARRITSSGGVLDGAGVRVSSDSDGFVQDDTDPDVAWNGKLYVVAYASFNENGQVGGITAGGVTASGAFEYVGFLGGGTLGATDNFDADQPAIAAGGKWFIVVWREEVPGGGVQIHGVRTDGDTVFSDPFTVSQASGTRSVPTIAFNGVFLAAWIDRRFNRNETWAARIGSDGAVQDPSGFVLNTDFPSVGSPALTKGSSTAQTYTLGFEVAPGTDSTSIQAVGVSPAAK